MWAAQALVPSSDWGSCRLGPPGARPADEAGRAAAGLADSKGLRRRRQQVQEAPSFLSQKLGPSIQEVQRDGGTCPACLREKLRSGPHQRPTQPSTSSAGGQGDGEWSRCALLPGGARPLEGPTPKCLCALGSQMGCGSCQNQFQKSSLPSPAPHTIPAAETQWLGGTLRGSPGLKDDQGPRIHSGAMLVA